MGKHEVDLVSVADRLDPGRRRSRIRGCKRLDSQRTHTRSKVSFVQMKEISEKRERSRRDERALAETAH